MKHKALPSLSAEHAAWLAATVERNRALYSGWSMVADDNSGGASGDGDADGNPELSDLKDAGAQALARMKADLKAAKAELGELRAAKGDKRGVEAIRQAARREFEDELKSLREFKAKAEGREAEFKAEQDAQAARDAARAEAQAELLHGRVEDKIEAKARAFADPEDAVAVLLRSHTHKDFLDSDNKINVEAITEALKDLSEKKPHLLAQGKRFEGDADQGARKESKGRPKSLSDAVTQAYT